MNYERFVNLIYIFLKETFRDKLNILVTILFPIIFLVIFGNIFINTGDTVKENIYTFGIYGNYSESINNHFSPHNIKHYNDFETFKKDVEERKVHGGIAIENKNNINIYFNERININQEQQNIKMIINNSIRNYFETPETTFFEAENETIGLGRVIGAEIDYLLSGILSLSILSGGMFATIGVFGRYKREGIIKRFMVTPVKPWEFVISSSLTKIMLNFLSIIIIITLSNILYDTNFNFNWITFIIVCLSASLGMMGLGVLILLIFKKTETSYSFASIFYTIMTFFSGIYFPTQVIPGQLRWITNILPVTYLIDLFRHTAGIETMNIIKFAIINLVFITFGISLIYLASKKYVNSEKSMEV